MSLHRLRWLTALLLGGGVFLSPSRVQALPENEIRKYVEMAADLESKSRWEDARAIYESLLGQKDPGLSIRDRYHQVLRRSWQVRRHQDLSYRKEVLSVDYGQALRLCAVVHNTLLDGSFDKRKVDPIKLFRKGLEELDAALKDEQFRLQYIPPSKQADIPAFRAYLTRTLNELGGLSRAQAVKKIGQVALTGERLLDLEPTITVMEFACGACYAIDEYTVYLTPSQLRELAHSLSQSEATSVGLRLAIQDNRIVVRSINMDSPLRGYVMENDEIVSVDKQRVQDLTLDQVTKLLWGQAGTWVDIEILPPDDMARTIRIQRQNALASVSFYQLPATPYFQLKVTGFTDGTLRDIDQALKQPGMKGLILDLRQNNGGIVESAIETARRFLSNGIIASSINQDTKQNRVYYAKNPNASTVPLIVLIDNETASAAEVLAGALKDNQRALLIGHTTFGKGCTQCVLRLPNATGGLPTGGMRLTVARFFSPRGVAYSGRGVTPHIYLDERMVSSQASALADPYLERAVDELNRMLVMAK